jgi:hypothetical protein
MWPFTRKTKAGPHPSFEKRSAMSGYTSMLLGMREAYISGRSGLGELTSAVQSCVSLWEAGLGIATVTGAPMLGRREMTIIGRGLATRGESLWLMRDELVPCSDWDLSTRNGRPTAYRCSISEAGGGTTTTALAGEVLHFRIGVDSAAPWAGSSPLRRSSLTATMLQAVEGALAETFENMPLGSSIIPFPEAPDVDLTTMARDFRGRRGRVLLRESVNVAAGGGPAPASDWKPADVTPDLERAVPIEALGAARDGIALAYGVLPSMLNPAAAGPSIREGQRHLATFCLQPIAETIAEECTLKFGAAVAIDVITPLQAYDTGASARSFKTMIDALAAAKEAGLSDAAVAGVLGKLDWKD